MKILSILFILITISSCQPPLSDSFEIKGDKLVIHDERLQKNETVKYLLRFINEDDWTEYRNHIPKMYKDDYKLWPEEIKTMIRKDSDIVKEVILFCFLNENKWSAERYDYSIRDLMILPLDISIKDEITLELLSKTKKLNIHYFGDDQFINPSSKILDYVYKNIPLKSSDDLMVYFNLKINMTHQYDNDMTNYLKKYKITIRQKKYIESVNEAYNSPEYHKETIPREGVEVAVYVGPGQDDPMH